MIDLNEMFKQFNKQYQVGTLIPTHNEASNITNLIQDEVCESFEEFFEVQEWSEGYDESEPKPNPDLKAYAKELTDILYITMERMTALHFNPEQLLNAVHQSNMSKTITIDQIDYELEVARKRYPHAVAIEVLPGVAVLRCTKTNKVIKPTTYEPAVITNEMISR